MNLSEVDTLLRSLTVVRNIRNIIYDDANISDVRNIRNIYDDANISTVELLRDTPEVVPEVGISLSSPGIVI